MVSVLAASIVDSIPDREKQKTIKLVFVASPLSTQHLLTRNQNNMSEWNDMSTCGLLFQ